MGWDMHSGAQQRVLVMATFNGSRNQPQRKTQVQCNHIPYPAIFGVVTARPVILSVVTDSESSLAVVTDADPSCVWVTAPAEIFSVVIELEPTSLEVTAPVANFAEVMAPSWISCWVEWGEVGGE